MNNSILDQSLPADSCPPAQTVRVWSPLQEAIYAAIADARENILIQAVAGSGKTTTLEEGTHRIAGSILSLAFNKAIAEVLRTRVSGDVKTLNALGHGLIMRNRPRARLDADKLKKILERISMPDEDRADWSYSVGRAVGLAKNNAVGIVMPADISDFREMLDQYLDIPSDKLDVLALYAHQAFNRSILDQETFDFDDQLYLPILNRWIYPHYDNVFVDEAQDLSPIQHLMLAAMQDSRIVAVGDRHQAIYGFRGAAHDSMDLLKDRFKMLELPLSITYRCPVRVVALAQRYCESIRPRLHAPEGTVEDRNIPVDDEDIPSDPKLWKTGLVICRNNAPLVKAILRHIRAKEPCRVLSNFMDSFQSFVRNLAKGRRGGATATRSADVLSRLDAWYTKELDAAQSRGKRAHLRDKYETTKLLLEEYPTVAEAVEAVRRLSMSRTGPTFSTVHKAKGLEAAEVYILRPDLMPAAYAQGDAEMQQEDNLTYVAITRSSDKLTFGVKETFK